MNDLPDPVVRTEFLGVEREPLVVIDGFSGMEDILLERARAAEYEDGGAAYPGIRAGADPGYLDRRRELLMRIVTDTFGIRQSIELAVAAYSIVTRQESELAPEQRIPHHDDATGEVIAIMHYLLDRTSGGTAFYRHRRTGFESITLDRLERYKSARQEDREEFGPLPPRYHYGDTRRYEMIGEVEARPDRLVLYRGRMLHSGVIPRPSRLTSDPGKGRVTVNMFLRGR